MKARRFIIDHWGDIAHLILLPFCVYINFEYVFDWGNEPVAYALLASYVIYTIFAFIRLIVLKKKCKLRDYLYPFYGLSSVSSMILFILSEDPNYLLEYKIYASNLLTVTLYTMALFSIVRIIIRLIRLHKRKRAEKAFAGEEQPL